jgi:hypothetical protein
MMRNWKLLTPTILASTTALSACGGGGDGAPPLVTITATPPAAGGETSALSAPSCTVTVTTNAPVDCKLSTSLTGPVTWSFTSAVPEGMVIQPKSGELRWTPMAAQTGAFAVSATVTNGSQSQNRNFTVTVSAGAADPAGIYVAPGGADSNTGTATSPFRTLKKAVQSVNPGQTIFVRGGEYQNSEYGQSWGSRAESSLVRITRAGTATQPITLRPFGNEYAKLRSDVTAIAIANAPYWRIEGFEIVGGAQSLDFDTVMSLWWTDGDAARRITGGGIQNNGSDHLTIRGNVIHDFPGGGVNNRNMEFLNIEDNIVYNNAWWTISGTNGVSSVSMATSDPANENVETVIYSGNLVFGNQQLIISHVFAKGFVSLELDEGAGMFLQNEGVTDVSPGTFRNRVGVENNILAYNGKGGVGLNGIGRTVGKVRFSRNSFYFNSRVAEAAGEITKRDSILHSVQDNLFHPRPDKYTIRSYTNEYANIFANATTGAANDGNKYPSIQVLAAVFADPAAGDFTPASGVPSGMGVISTIRQALSKRLAEYGIAFAAPTQVVDAAYIATMKQRIFDSWPASHSAIRLDDPVSGYSYTYAQRCHYPAPPTTTPC